MGLGVCGQGVSVYHDGCGVCCLVGELGGGDGLGGDDLGALSVCRCDDYAGGGRYGDDEAAGGVCGADDYVRDGGGGGCGDSGGGLVVEACDWQESVVGI